MSVSVGMKIHIRTLVERDFAEDEIILGTFDFHDSISRNVANKLDFESY